MLDPSYVTSAEAARCLGYTIQHVRRLITDRKLQGFKIGRDWVVLKSSVEAFSAKDEYLQLPFD